MNFLKVCVTENYVPVIFDVNGRVTLFMNTITFLVLDEGDDLIIFRSFVEVKFFGFFKDGPNEFEVFRDMVEEVIIFKIFLKFLDFFIKSFLGISLIIFILNASYRGIP